MTRKQAPAASTAYLDKTAYSYDEKRFRSAGGRSIDRIEKRQLASVFERLNGDEQVFEVGCGTGRFLLFACQSGFRCTALDASPDMVDQARHITEEFSDVEFYVANAASIPVGDNSFDLTFSIRLLNQTGTEEQALAIVSEMFRVTKPGGMVLVEFVNYFRPGSRRKPLGMRDVRLRPKQVIETARSASGEILSISGAFFFGMTAQHYVPSPLRPLLNFLDFSLCAIAPRLCARCYILFFKSPR